MSELCSAEAAEGTAAALSIVHAAARSLEFAKATELQTLRSEEMETSGMRPRVSAQSCQHVVEV